MATLSTAKRIVIKIGSSLLVSKGQLRDKWFFAFAEDVARLRSRNIGVVLVSSGSIAMGRGVLGLEGPELALEQSQAAAAIGQIRLAGAYQSALEPHNITAAQVLVTLEDSTNRRRYLNTRATLEHLLSLGVVTIVNENDTVATDEIRYGDNDRLAAQIAVTVGADQLILLSDVDGLYSANPADDPSASRLEIVEKITPEIEAMAGDAASGLSRGGMKTKIMAAKTATAAGCAMAITKGDVMHPISALDDGANATWFLAHTDPQAARKRWIAAMKPRGEISVDQGAAEALMSGKSLLPAGVVAVSGPFGRGDPVAISDSNGNQLGQGLSRYTWTEADQIKGRRTSDIEGLLGYPGRAALIHRDDMVL